MNGGLSLGCLPSKGTRSIHQGSNEKIHFMNGKDGEFGYFERMNRPSLGMKEDIEGVKADGGDHRGNDGNERFSTK